MEFVIVFDVIGISAFVVSGFLVGIRRNLDMLGVVIMSAATALGGGIVRDTLALKIPFAFSTYYPSATMLAAFICCLIFRRFINDNLERKLFFVIMDAIGLVAFAISGAIVGLNTELNLFGVTILSFITAVGGGIIRDILVNEVPFCLKSEIYGIVAIYCAVTLFLYTYFIGEYNAYIIIVISLSAFIFRIVAYIKKWQLPILNNTKKS